MGTYKIAKKITPTFNNVLVRFEEQDEDIFENGMITVKYGINGEPKKYLQVVAVGKNCQFVKEGDYVSVNWERYKVPMTKPSGMNIDGEKRELRFTLAGKEIYMDNSVYYMINEADIMYVLTDYVTVDNKEPSFVDIGRPKIIV